MIETREPSVASGARLCGTGHYAIGRGRQTLSQYSDLGGLAGKGKKAKSAQSPRG